MKKLISIFAVIACVVPLASMGAVSVKSSGIKKAAPVSAKQQANKMDSMTSLLPAVMGLVGSVQSLKAEQQKLGSGCEPTSDEKSIVDNLVKEWAKIGTTDASSAVSGLGDPCSTGKDNSGSHYQGFIDNHRDEGDVCYETFSSKSDEGTVWYGFPKVSSGELRDVDNKKTGSISNIYDIFAKIPFSDADYTIAEAAKITKLKEKFDRCAPAKLKAAKSEALGNFVIQAMGNVGQTTGASGMESVMQAVQSLGGSGNLKSVLPSLGTMATQALDK